jgi:putative transposase
LKTRKIVRWRLTEHPPCEFVWQQIIEITYDLPEQATLIHDNDSQFTSIDFTQYNIKAVNTSLTAPNMNVYIERLIGSVRREALDQFLLFSEKQVSRIILEYGTIIIHYVHIKKFIIFQNVEITRQSENLERVN